MKNFLPFLKRGIFLSFILFTISAGEGPGCECGSKSKLSSSDPNAGKSNPSHGSKEGGVIIVRVQVLQRIHFNLNH